MLKRVIKQSGRLAHWGGALIAATAGYHNGVVCNRRAEFYTERGLTNLGYQNPAVDAAVWAGGWSAFAWVLARWRRKLAIQRWFHLRLPRRRRVVLATAATMSSAALAGLTSLMAIMTAFGRAHVEDYECSGPFH